jgi:hypothetical protein
VEKLFGAWVVVVGDTTFEVGLIGAGMAVAAFICLGRMVVGLGWTRKREHISDYQHYDFQL